MADNIVNLDSIFKKGVRSKDEVQVGTVVGTSEEAVVIERGSRHLYVIPKVNVEAFDGNEILLNLPSQEITKYEQHA